MSAQTRNDENPTNDDTMGLYIASQSACGAGIGMVICLLFGAILDGMVFGCGLGAIYGFLYGLHAGRKVSSARISTLGAVRDRVMHPRPLLAVLCSALLLAGCAERDSAKSETSTTTTLTPAVSSTADASPKSSRASSDARILFTSNRDGNSQIYVMNSDGSGQTCLTNGSYDDYDPEWSPDRSRIAFSSTRGGYLGDIYLMNADGSKPTRLTYTKGFDTTVRNKDAAWSPDGSKIAFTITGGLAPLNRIYTLHVPTKNHAPSGHIPHAIPVHDRLSSYTNPAWSPDGSKIAVTQFAGTIFGALLKINVMNVDGTRRRDLIKSLASEDEAAWSPDGSKIAFSAYLKSGTWEIYIINTSGSNEVRITRNSADDFSPTWSPDGSRIAFASDRSGRFEIYIVDTDGANVKQLTQEGGSDPDWEPGLGAGSASSTPVADPSKPTRTAGMPPARKYDYLPAWSPNGKKIVFSRGYKGQVYLMNADGTNETRLINNSADNRWLSWSPDGSKIAFTSDRDASSRYEIYYGGQ